MKKYLIKGALALFAGAFLFSCAEKESEYVPLAQQKVKAFDEVFKEVYGDNIDPYQNWGFSDQMIVANGDSVEPTIIEEEIPTRFFGARTRTINVNGNLWEDCPEVGTKEASDVLAYLADHKDNTTAPSGLTNYFVTQIYKGDETYTNEDGGSVGTGSDKMNNLHIAMSSTATINNGVLSAEGSTAWEHINNFNAGNCTDWSAGTDGHGNTLVLNGGTYDFAYQGAEDSKYHNRWCAIDGRYVTRTDGLADNYAGKYYICFDFEQDVDAKTAVYFRDENGNPQNAYVIGNYTTVEEATGAKCVVEYGEWVNGVFNKTGEKEYVFGRSENCTEWRVDNVINGNMIVEPNSSYKDWIIRLVEAERHHDYGTGSSLSTWNADEYDWSQVTNQSGRIFCEDLGKAAREDLDYNDVVFDVIIWKYTHYHQPMMSTTTWTTTDGEKDANSESTSTPEKNGNRQEVDATYYAQIQLLAAGGTLPLTVAGKEVHQAFGFGVTTMVNTRDANSTAFGSYEFKDPDQDPVYIGDISQTVTFEGHTYDLKLTAGISRAKDVPIVVNYDNNQVAKLIADEGEPPHKLFVPFDTRWTSERKPLNLAYPNFKRYVVDSSDTSWVRKPETDFLYDKAATGLASMPKVMKMKSISNIESMDILTSESYPYTTWGLKEIVLNVDKFYPGDRLRFYGSGINRDSYITVVFADSSRPYFVDTKFAESDKDGNYPFTACIEVLLDEAYCDKLNSSKNENGKIMLQVQGRSFTLDQITRVPF